MNQTNTGVNTQPIIKVSGIGRLDADSRSWLFRDLSLAITAGERVALVGPSGSGKTVLLRSLAMLDPLDAGTLRWHGERVAHEAVPQYRSRVMYLHQRPALVEGTVLENLEHPFQYAVHRHREFDRALIVRRLEALGKDKTFLNKRVRDLSGGEAQITALLRAVQLEPEVLLLDEPTSALDHETSDAVQQCVRQWHSERMGERSYVVVSHNLQQVQRIVDRTLTLKSGRVTEGNR